MLALELTCIELIEEVSLHQCELKQEIRIKCQGVSYWLHGGLDLFLCMDSRSINRSVDICFESTSMLPSLGNAVMRSRLNRKSVKSLSKAFRLLSSVVASSSSSSCSFTQVHTTIIHFFEVRDLLVVMQHC